MDMKQDYICKVCGKKQESVGVVQSEIHYYCLFLKTEQLEDFHGDESVESANYFCLNCDAKIEGKDIFIDENKKEA